MFKFTVSSILGFVLLTACGSSADRVAERSDYFSFKYNKSILSGYFNRSYYDENRVRTIVGKLACQSGKLGSLNVKSVENGVMQFAAKCSGEPKYPKYAGFTVYGADQVAYTTTSINGNLVQIKTDLEGGASISNSL